MAAIIQPGEGIKMADIAAIIQPGEGIKMADIAAIIDLVRV